MQLAALTGYIVKRVFFAFQVILVRGKNGSQLSAVVTGRLPSIAGFVVTTLLLVSFKQFLLLMFKGYTTTMLAYKQIHVLIGKPSKDPRHPDYAPSIFSFKQQDASPAVSNLVHLSRAESRRKRHRDEVESNRLAKTPRMETIEIENDGPTGSNSTDPYTSDILIVQSECNQLQQKNMPT